MANVVIIPARYASTRFPGKPLAKETGKYLIQHVYESVQKARCVDRIIVATDDRRIADAVEEFGGEAAMTSPTHPSGTDRLAEVARGLEDRFDVVINIQGDEPEIEPEMIETLVATLTDDEIASMATLATPFRDRRDVLDPNQVKVVRDQHGRAIYFSRNPIPCGRDCPDRLADVGLYLLHLGVYAYHREFLLEFAAWSPTPLEKAEKLEQLRALEHGERIAVAVVEYHSCGIDTPEQYAEFVRRCRTR